MKFVGHEWWPNVTCYAKLAVLTFLVMNDPSVIHQIYTGQGQEVAKNLGQTVKDEFNSAMAKTSAKSSGDMAPWPRSWWSDRPIAFAPRRLQQTRTPCRRRPSPGQPLRQECLPRQPVYPHNRWQPRQPIGRILPATSPAAGIASRRESARRARPCCPAAIHSRPTIDPGQLLPVSRPPAEDSGNNSRRSGMSPHGYRKRASAMGCPQSGSAGAGPPSSPAGRNDSRTF